MASAMAESDLSHARQQQQQQQRQKELTAQRREEEELIRQAFLGRTSEVERLAKSCGGTRAGATRPRRSLACLSVASFGSGREIAALGSHGWLRGGSGRAGLG